MYKFLLGFMLVIFASYSHAGIQYVNAKITSLEVCESGQMIYTAFLSDMTPEDENKVGRGNACANGEIYPYVRVVQSTSEVDTRSGLMSLAIVAYTTGADVRIRFDDSNMRAMSITLLPK